MKPRGGHKGGETKMVRKARIKFIGIHEISPKYGIILRFKNTFPINNPKGKKDDGTIRQLFKGYVYYTWEVPEFTIPLFQIIEERKGIKY